MGERRSIEWLKTIVIVIILGNAIREIKMTQGQKFVEKRMLTSVWLPSSNNAIDAIPSIFDCSSSTSSTATSSPSSIFSVFRLESIIRAFSNNFNIEWEIWWFQ